MTDSRFKERMASLLGDGYEAFFAALSSKSVRGARINPIKCKDKNIPLSAGLGFEELSYVKDGYIMHTGEGGRKHPRASRRNDLRARPRCYGNARSC